MVLLVLEGGDGLGEGVEVVEELDLHGFGCILVIEEGSGTKVILNTHEYESNSKSRE